MTGLALERRVRAAGYGHLWAMLRTDGIVHLRYPVTLTRPTVLTPESAEPVAGSCAWYRLTPAQHRELLAAMFGDDSGVAVVP